MISSVLIANRGEIANRIIRTARRLGVRTLAIYSPVDAHLPFVREADDAVHINAATPRETYLDIERIIKTALEYKAEAVHPGYGFLSENADFAEAVRKAGLVWIGAPPNAIRAMGLKDAAKERMIAAGVPVTPGYLGADQSPAVLRMESERISYPVLIKAVAGGGGKGMRRVDSAEQFNDALESCRREAIAAFGDDRVLIEKYVLNPRHIEVQVFGDQYRHIVHLFERDCSLQRRHQKVIEEAPAPGMDSETRRAVCEAAVRAAAAVDYEGAGTIEFIADGSEGLRSDRIWFMEMNTRLQVEHPVTEAITGQDLVEWQFRVASGEPLPLTQDQLAINGWAVEARLYAENPAAGFLPAIGVAKHLKLPIDVRVDTGIAEGDEVTAFYDPMIAKLVAHGPNRKAAARRLASACGNIEVWPLKTNAGFLTAALSSEAYLSGEVDTGFIERRASELLENSEPPAAARQAAARALLASGPDQPWLALVGFRANAVANRDIRVRIAEVDYVVTLDDAPSGAHVVAVNGERVVFYRGGAWPFSASRYHQRAGEGAHASGSGAIVSPMPGRVVSVEISVGDRVIKGAKLVVVEAMKMEHSLVAPFDGVVTELRAKVGDQISEGALVIRIDEPQHQRLG
jgi:3-methylcrotonyl-CoA carboxylase alpha subunit